MLMLMLVLMRRGEGWGRYREGNRESGLGNEIWMQMPMLSKLNKRFVTKREAKIVYISQGKSSPWSPS